MKNTIHRLVGLSKLLSTAALAVYVGACTRIEAGETESTANAQNPLYYLLSGIWPQREIPVCWETANQDAEKGWVKATLRGQRSWSEQGNLSFVGWGACDSSSIGIRVTGGDVNASVVGQSNGTAFVTLDFGPSPERTYVRCGNNSLNREQCIKATARHEFGHAIGYAHEHNRIPKSPDCTSDPQGDNGDTTFGSFDIRSLTAYCNFSIDMSPLDRRGTERVYGQVYGDPPRLRDFDGDGHADILCHDAVTGYMWIDNADEIGLVDSNDWERDAHACYHDTGRLFKGDFNGDGHADLLCHDVVTGYKWIDYADEIGAFDGWETESDAQWCNHETGRLMVGDFDGDGHDDILCHDVATGYKWIRYADDNGAFDGREWESNAHFCYHEAGRLMVGDFDGDGHDDLLCHDVATGYKWIRYADDNGAFDGREWESDAHFCYHDTGELHIGDFNGDGHDDLLCHDLAVGYKWISYADDNGAFDGWQWERDAWTCSDNAERLFVGDLNGDGHDDLLCHDVSSGHKWIDLADENGAFNGTFWEDDTHWCDHDAGELL